MNPDSEELLIDRHRQLLRLVWRWIGDHHEYGFTGDDLIQQLTEAGYSCPDDLKES